MLRAQSKAILLTLLGASLVCPRSQATLVADLYIAQVPSTGLSGSALDDAFGAALDQVLVKVTGQ
ncbi:MAG: DUF2066 domain-containing protein, partial [Gammaproteobacteria bacterium]